MRELRLRCTGRGVLDFAFRFLPQSLLLDALTSLFEINDAQFLFLKKYMVSGLPLFSAHMRHAQE